MMAFILCFLVGIRKIDDVAALLKTWGGKEMQFPANPGVMGFQ